MNQNAFGLKLYEVKEVLGDEKVESNVRNMLVSVLLHLGFSNIKSHEIVNDVLFLAKNYSKVIDYEKKANSILKKAGVHETIPAKLSLRAKRIFSQIIPHLKKGSVLDYGCGDGKVGEMLSKKGFEVELNDIYEHPHISQTGLQFRLFNQDGDIPAVSNAFDNTLALTVYHHTDDPIHAIKESARVTKVGGHVLIIESVYGVHGAGLNKKQQDKIKSYLDLTTEQQRRVNIFFDHFYNRVIHYSEDPLKKVNVPFNFNTPDNWKKIFEKYGFRQEKVIHLALDQPAVPEYHTLHVLKKIK